MEKNRNFAVSDSLLSTVTVTGLVLGLGMVVVSSVALASTSQQQETQPQSQSKSNAQYSRLPEGPGKDTLVRVCSKCHSPTNVVANGQAKEGWEDTITKMAGLGATGTDEDYTEILDYLIKNFPPNDTKVNMNKATAGEIEAQLGFTTRQSSDIVAYREKVGAFKSPEDLKHIPQMDAKEVDSRRNRMAFQ